MSIWQYIPTDNHTIEHLEVVRLFYSGVIISTNKSLDKALSYEKYGLPNWRTEVLRRQMGVNDALESFWNIQEAIDTFNKKELQD